MSLFLFTVLCLITSYNWLPYPHLFVFRWRWYLRWLLGPFQGVTQFSRVSPMLSRRYACSVAQSCPTLCDLMNSSLPGSFVHGISQARILQWVAISSPRGSSRPRDRTHGSCICCIGRQILYHCSTWEAPKEVYILLNFFVFVSLSCLLLREVLVKNLEG